MSSLEERERRELAFWREHDEETVRAGDPDNIARKLSELPVLLDCLDRYAELFDAPRVLELGAGQGWVACAVKRRFPGAHVIATDLSQRALLAVPAWERHFEVRLDGRYACRSSAIPERPGSIDLVLAFAAAHHFGAHRRTLAEVARVLAPGGRALYLYEPACPRVWHALARARVILKRPSAPEDVLILSRIRALARDAGLHVRVDHYPSTLSRRGIAARYYEVLSRSRAAQRLLPCTSNLVFSKARLAMPSSV